MLVLGACTQPTSTPKVVDGGYDGTDRSWVWAAPGTETPPIRSSIGVGDAPLSAEPFTAATNGWGPIGRDRSVGGPQAGDGQPLSIGGQAYARGFGVHSASSMSFALLGQCSRLTATVGIDDEVGDRGSATFQVYADGQKLFDSGVLTGADAARSLDVDLRDRDELRLVVTDAGDQIDYDHADWAEPTLTSCAGVGSADTRTALRVRAGGAALSLGGIQWAGCASVAACQGFVRGGFAYSPSPAPPITGAVAPASAELYHAEWTGGQSLGVPAGAPAFSFRIPVQNGAYQVRLHFAELNKTAPGERIFDVVLENKTVLPGFDIFQEAGGLHRATVRSFTVDVQDGQVDLDFIRQIENAKLSALEIIPLAPDGSALPEAAPLAWQLRAPMPTTLYEGQGAAVDGRLYVFGGFDQNLDGKPIATRASWVYDPPSDRWAALRAAPEAVTHAGVAVDGQFIYLAGGFLGDHPGPQTAQVWKYDTAADTWAALPPLPAARGAGALVRVGRDLHFFGGTERSGRSYLRDSGDHWVLNADAPTAWTPAAPLPNPRNHLGAVVRGGLIYALGGQHLGNESTGNLSDLQVYTPATNSWRALTPMPLPMGHISASTLVWKGRIVVVGGVTQATQGGVIEGREAETVLSYDPTTDRWVYLTALPSPRQSPVAAVIDGALVVSSGSTSVGPTDSTWIGR